MKGCKSLDRLANEEGTVDGDITISGPVDSVYYDVPKDITPRVGGGGAVTMSGAGGWKDAVVWSPWTDMEACYKDFVCVENAACAEPVVVEAGGEWEATTVLKSRPWQRRDRRGDDPYFDSLPYVFAVAAFVCAPLARATLMIQKYLDPNTFASCSF